LVPAETAPDRLSGLAFASKDNLRSKLKLRKHANQDRPNYQRLIFDAVMGGRVRFRDCLNIELIQPLRSNFFEARSVGTINFVKP
jgi:hypothetical protein